MGCARILVITREQDVAADMVLAHLHHRDVPVARFDLGDLPGALTHNAYLVPGRGRWTGALHTPHRDIDLSAVRSVWYRKPAPVSPPAQATRAQTRWAAAEATAGLGGLLTALPHVRWVNHPHRTAEADHKPLQLALADAAGLPVPASLLTCDPAQARAFAHAHRGTGILYKPLTGSPRPDPDDPEPDSDGAAGQATALWATEVTAAMLDGPAGDGIAATSHLLQARVPCAYAVRLTAIGEKLFAVRIDAPAGTLDWRRTAPGELTYTPTQPPVYVADGLRHLMRTLDLTYCASDWIVTPEGLWTFIGDINPGGQWAWIEHETGLPLARTLADALTPEPT